MTYSSLSPHRRYEALRHIDAMQVWSAPNSLASIHTYMYMYVYVFCIRMYILYAFDDIVVFFLNKKYSRVRRLSPLPLIQGEAF